jgi:predicted transcriptional regulator
METLATSLKLPAAVKRDMERLAKKAGLTTHAFMVQTLAEKAANEKQHAKFVSDGLRAAQRMDETGLGYEFDEVKAFLLAKVRREAPRALKPKKLRGL